MKKIKKILLIFVLTVLVSLSGCLTPFTTSLGFKRITINVGEELVLTTNTNEEQSKNVVWTSSNEEVATVDEEGCVVAIKAGYTYVKATYEQFESTVYVRVVEKEKEDNRVISITGNQTVLVNETSKLEALYQLESGESIIWKSSNENIATVNNGTVTGILPGMVTISAQSSLYSNKKAEITILVRTGTGVQDIIYNYIYNNSYELNGSIDLTSLNVTLTNLVANTKNSVLGVSNYKTNRTKLALSGVGSGVVIDKEDLGNGKYKYTLITNYHVVKDNNELRIYIGWDDNREVLATLIKGNPDLDLAVLSFEYDKEIEALKIAKNDDYRVGDFVYAIGNPNGYDYYNSVTFGIISYKERVLEGESAKFIQHDAAINSGNSGGPLFNMKGEIIGINTLKMASTEIEGMFFAISLNDIRNYVYGE